MVTRRLAIVQYPDPVLRKKALRIDRLTPEMQHFIAEMGEIMHEAHGVGLAAPQLGISLRIIVVDVDDKLEALINPQIVAREGTQRGLEGCLSLPGLHGEVTRAERVTVVGLNKRGKRVTFSGDGLWARAMQHEIDHLDGVLFIDLVHPETLYWTTDDEDEDGQPITRPTSLEDACKVFDSQSSLARA